MQDEIARAVVEKLKVKLLGEVDASMVTRPTENLEAYNLYLKGRYYFGRLSGPTLEEAFGCYTQALALEPNYAQAHAGVASVQAARAVLSLVDPSQVLPAAKAAASRALALDETVADAHDAMGRVLQYYEWKWGEAEREYRRALELNPGDTFTRAGLAALLVQVGRADVAVAEVRIPLMWNAESGDLERGFRRSGTLVGAQRRLVSQ